MDSSSATDSAGPGAAPGTAPADRSKLPTAKWGAACAPCASAKAKCIRSDETPGSKCDRCQRLLKDCTGQVHRPRKKRQARPSRTAQIEERLNGLVHLLQASGELTAALPAQASPHDASRLETPASNQHTPSASPGLAHRLPDAAAWEIPASFNEFAVPACICRPRSGSAPPPPASDAALLDVYRRELQPVYPFVIVPPQCSAAALRASRPFLMSAIRMVSSFGSLRSMQAQLCDLMSHIADHMLVRSARSLDLLQGIIVMLGWYQYHCFVHAQVNNLLYLATSLVAELALNKPPGIREQARLMVARPVEPPGRTNEERRALAAVWFVTSAMVTNFGRLEPVKHSAYLQSCVGELEMSCEYETDQTLVFLVRIQHLAQRIFELNTGDKERELLPGIPTAPRAAYMLAFQNELDRLRDSLPPHLKTDRTMQAYVAAAELRLYEPPVVDMALVRQLSESLTTGTAEAGTPLDRIYQTSVALKRWFDLWLSVPVAEYYRQPVALAAQLVYTLTMLGRWAKLATPRTMYEGGTPMPRCSAPANTSAAVYNADPEPPVPGDADLGPARAARRRDSRDYLLHEGEAELPAAVGALQSLLQTQPGLAVNIPEILSDMCSRFEQASMFFEAASSEPDRPDCNMWSYSALKVRITRVKLERWAELVSAGVDGSLRGDGPSLPPRDGPTAHWRGSYPQETAYGAINDPGAAQFGSLAHDQTQIQNFLGGAPWTGDVMDGIDPTVWFDGYLDWGAVVMNSMGTLGQ